MAKDLFSRQANAYSHYRPTYPQALFDYVLGFVDGRTAAWDCATGNGQAAVVLAEAFQRVEATDISEEQLKNAVHKPNIDYGVTPAEQTPFATDSFDLITIATAYHWLNWDRFHREATRVGKQGAVIAAWAYNLLHCTDKRVNDCIRYFYYEVVHQYWDKERRHVENGYESVTFDFDPLPPKDFFIDVHWTKEEFIGYLSTWSSVQTYQSRTMPRRFH